MTTTTAADSMPSAIQDSNQTDRAQSATRSAARTPRHAAAQAAPRSILRDTVVIVAVVTTGAAIGTALNVQSGVSAGIAGAIALVAAGIMIAIHALVRSTGNVAELDAELQSLRKEMRRLTQPGGSASGSRRAAPVQASPQQQTRPQSGQAYQPDSVYPYGEPVAWPVEAPAPASIAASAADEMMTSAYTPEPQHDTLLPDLEFERLQSLIRKLAAETAGPRAAMDIANAEAIGSLGAAALARSDATKSEVGKSDSLQQPAQPQSITPATYTTGHWSQDLPAASADYRSFVEKLAPPPSAPTTGLLSQLSEAITAERVDVYLTPVQGLADRKAHHYEISVRLNLRDGAALEHGALSTAARNSGLGGRLDALRLSRVARVARRVDKRGTAARVLSSFIGTSLAEDAFLEAVADQLGTDPAARIVMGFSQADVRAFGAIHWDTIQTMSEMGLGFALEDVTDLDMDFASLQRRGFRFVKLDASVFLDGLPAPSGPLPAADICRHFSDLGLSLIVGQIDDEWVAAEIMGLGVVYGQGVLFGAPRPVKAEVVETAH